MDRSSLPLRPDTRPSLPLESYAGRYRHQLYDDLEIALADGTLALELVPDPGG